MRVRDGDEPVDVGRHTPRGGGRGRASMCARGCVCAGTWAGECACAGRVYAYTGDGNRDIRVREDVPMGRWMRIGLHGSVDGQLGKNHSWPRLDGKPSKNYGSQVHPKGTRAEEKIVSHEM